MTKPEISPKLKKLFIKITDKLQASDNEKGASLYLYTRSRDAILEGRSTKSNFKFADHTVGYFSLTDILDDAINEGYINSQQWQALYKSFNNS